ncbi:MAG TPA: hypothetical protein VF668_20105 [Pyrinomonadaceae bacterium]|jgi:hypothetical protein
MQVNPAVVVAAGPAAEEVVARARRLILQSTGHEELPAVFQFVTLGAGAGDAGDAVGVAYRAATNKNAALSAEESGAITVNSSRVESFVIAPLDAEHYAVAAQAARALKLCQRGAISGDRNAIFLLPRRTSAQDFAALQAVRDALESDLKAELTFNRCFFIDDADESGQSIGGDDVVELVARFVSLAVASELRRDIRSFPRPYIGEGPVHRAYASFGCSTIGFDPRRLTGVLSDYLASDICRHLFADRGLKLDETEWPGRAAAWLNASLGKELAGPPSAELKDLDQDVDYDGARRLMDELTYGACRALGDDLRSYQGFLDHCLSRGVVRLEALSKEMKELKRRINEIEVRILLGEVERPGEGGGGVPREERYLKWALFLGGAGLLAVAASLFLGGLQPEALLVLRVLGALLILAGVVAAFLKRRWVQYLPAAPASPLAEELRRLKAEHDEKRKRQNIHVALLTRLDLAHANLECLRRSAAAPELRRERSIFDVDIIDAELARKFYDDRYQSRDTDVASFMSGSHLDEVYRAAFSLLGVKLTDSVSRYCDRCFERVASFDLEQMFRLRQSLSGYAQLQTASSPFWYPRSTADSEKIVLASIPERSPESMRALLNNTFGAQNIKYVNGRDPCKATLVQIAYGQTLANILGSPPSGTNGAGKP